MSLLDRLQPGWRTHLFFPRFDATVIDRGDHVVVRTPQNPTFWWGNFLLFPQPPVEGDEARWRVRFDAEIRAHQPSTRHLAYGIDADRPHAMPADFAAAGFRHGHESVLTLEPQALAAAPRALPPGFVLRPLDIERELDQAVELQVATDSGRFEPVAYRVFRRRQMARYAAMQRAGRGAWFGVFADRGRTLVADCGLFRGDGPDAGLGRFQFVSTHPDWRRRGLCSALIHGVCRHGFERLHLERLVIGADPADVAIGIYRSVGFTRACDVWSFERPGDAKA